MRFGEIRSWSCDEKNGGSTKNEAVEYEYDAKEDPACPRGSISAKCT